MEREQSENKVPEAGIYRCIDDVPSNGFTVSPTPVFWGGSLPGVDAATTSNEPVRVNFQNTITKPGIRIYHAEA